MHSIDPLCMVTNILDGGWELLQESFKTVPAQPAFHMLIGLFYIA